MAPNGSSVSKATLTGLICEAATPRGTSLISHPNGAFTVTQDVNWFSTLRARVGWLAATPNLLVLRNGRLGHIGEVNSTTFWGTDFIGAASGEAVSLCFARHQTQVAPLAPEKSTEVGFALGAGAEYAFRPLEPQRRISVRQPWRSVSVTAVSTTPQAGNAPASYTANFGATDFHVVRAGLNWRSRF